MKINLITDPLNKHLKLVVFFILVKYVISFET